MGQRQHESHNEHFERNEFHSTCALSRSSRSGLNQQLKVAKLTEINLWCEFQIALSSVRTHGVWPQQD